MRRLLLIVPSVAVGMGISALAPELIHSTLEFAGLHAHERTGAASAPGAPGHKHEEGEHEPDDAQGVIAMSPAQIDAAQIVIGDAGKGTLARRLTVPGVVIADPDRLARVPAKVVGTVAEMRKRLGDPVVRGEVVAVLDSREVADAKSEYLTASVNLDLQKTMFERAQALWDKRISAEQQYLQARAVYTETELRADLARQKLFALGLDADEVAASARRDASKSAVSNLRTYEVRSPISGRVVERRVDVGAPVGKEGDPSDLYAVADLSAVWIEIAVPTGDLDAIRDGQSVTITSGRDTTRRSEGKIVFISPMLNQETRSARVIAAIDNTDLSWRPGSFVVARITVEEHPVEIRIPRAAIQTIAGEPVVFVRTEEGFAKRAVVLGKEDDEAVEVVSGLLPTEKIAVANTFLLKAELGKAEAEHAH